MSSAVRSRSGDAVERGGGGGDQRGIGLRASPATGMIGAMVRPDRVAGPRHRAQGGEPRVERGGAALEAGSGGGH